MNRKIVICSDGTGNRGGLGKDTNVWRIYNAAAGREAQNQFAIYDDGVGTERILLKRAVGAMFGLGLSNNIRELYQSLCQVYEPGADIYLFGFSRGAHTIRTLAGFITSQGILNPTNYDNDELFAKDIFILYDAYRFLDYRKPELCRRRWFEKNSDISKASDNSSNSDRLASVRENLFQSNSSNHWNRYHTSTQQQLNIPRDEEYRDLLLPENRRVPIRFIGVWDTVDAVGFPMEWIADYWNAYAYRYQFRDYKLSPFVSHACHALAIDDARQTFKPRLFDVRDETNGEAQDRIKQIWFAGVHSNIGGGYPKQGLAHISLCWIAQEAKRHGMIIDGNPTKTVGEGSVPLLVQEEEKLYHAQSNPHDRLYNSRSGLSEFYRYHPRDVTTLNKALSDQEPIVDASVIARVARRTGQYSPWNLPESFRIVDSCDSNPLKFFSDAGSENRIAAKWSNIFEKKQALNNVKRRVGDPGKNEFECLDAFVEIPKQTRSLSRYQSGLKIAAVFVLIGFLTLLAQGILDQAPLFSIMVFVLAVIAFIHHSIDISYSEKIKRNATLIWANCISEARISRTHD